MKYPTFKVSGSPTPNEKLMVCEVCQKAEWVGHATGRTRHCCHSRMREATPQEYDEGRLALNLII